MNSHTSVTRSLHPLRFPSGRRLSTPDRCPGPAPVAPGSLRGVLLAAACLLGGLLSGLPARASDVFFDGFESGNFTAGAWENNQADVQRTYKFAGTYAARLQGTDSITKSFPTPGFTNVVLSYYRRTRQFDASGDFFYSEWYDGTTWTILETLTTNTAAFGLQTFALPAGAENNPNFKIRFRTSCGGTDFAYVDNVKIQANYPAGGGEPDVPHVTALGLANPNIIQLSIGERQVIPGPQIPYIAQAGDTISTPNPPSDPNRYLTRNGSVIGTIITPAANVLWTWDLPTGSPLLTTWADTKTNYSISSPTDPNYTTAKNPSFVYRKTKPSNYARAAVGVNDVALKHELFLQLPNNLVAGNQYTVTFNGNPYAGGTMAPQTFTYSPTTMRSPAVHVSQLGFHPTDAVKVAFLSTWMGNGGKLDYTAGAAFQVLNDSTGAVVFNGTTTLQKAYNVTEIGSAFGAKNTSLTNVYQLDFSSLTTPGTYRIYVPGIGCSYPFTIGTPVWESAFKTSVKALYNQRSGIALSTAYTNYNRPRDHNPADGLVVRLSTAPLMDGANGLDSSAPDNFGELIAGLLPPDQTLGSEAWGGYHDAGDWDRRIQHLESSTWLLTLAEEFPAYFASLSLNLPESGGSYPDVIDEALWNIDFYRRLQITSGPNAGGVRGGIEHDAHPRLGEAAWQDTNMAIAYAPDPWCSYWYAGAAAMAAQWLQTNGFTAQAAVYQSSAISAYNWAIAQNLANYQMGSSKSVTDMRNFADAALFRLTGNTSYHTDFVNTTDFAAGTAGTYEQRFGSWLYVRTNLPGMNATIKTNITDSYVTDANTLVNGCNDTGFRWTMFPTFFYGLGAMSTSLESPILVKAHLLTGNATYLNTLTLSCQTGAGANPDNRVYTTGLGANPVVRPLDADSRYFRDMPTPLGLTVLGPSDLSLFSSDIYRPSYSPASTGWPIIETYHDVWLDPNLTEYTVHHPITQNFVAWGYLAALHH